MSPRPVPDETLVKRALRVRQATETPMEAHVREEYDAMMAAARIGLDAGRKLWPVDQAQLPGGPDRAERVREAMKQATLRFQQTYEELDKLSVHFHGPLVEMALLGKDPRLEATIVAAEDEAKVGPRHEAQHAPEITE